MRSGVAPKTEEILSLLNTLRSSIQKERRCVIDEREAFNAFQNRLESIESTEPVHVEAAPQLLQLEQTPGLDRVRGAYESTVMSTPHYNEEYNDTYKQSVAQEFGLEVGLLLTEGTWFDQQLKSAVLKKAGHCQQEREELFRTLEIEQESIDTVENKLRPITDELQSFPSECSTKQSYGTLEAEWNRLQVLSEKIDKIAFSRQTAIKQQRGVFNITSDSPDIPTYLYQDFEANYPLLSALVNMQRTIKTYCSEREQALSVA
jgi:hypothetical protein